VHWSLPREGNNDAELNIGKITGRNMVICHMISHSDTIIQHAFPTGHPIQEKLIGALAVIEHLQKYSMRIIIYLMMRLNPIKIWRMIFLKSGLKYLGLMAS
jgi:hypothetical protein